MRDGRLCFCQVFPSGFIDFGSLRRDSSVIARSTSDRSPSLSIQVSASYGSFGQPVSIDSETSAVMIPAAIPLRRADMP